MIDIALDPVTGDLLIDNFDLQLVSDIDQIAQNLAIRLRFIEGEWYLDILAGIPYYQYFFIKNPNEIQMQSFLTNEIVSTNGITELKNYAMKFDGQQRVFTVNFSCIAINTEMQIELTLP